MKQLVKRAMNQDTNAFLELIELNMQSMYKVAKSFLKNDEDVADVMQETILICFEKLETLREPRYFKTWLIRILINNCNSIIKNNKRECLLEEFLEIKDPNVQNEYLEFVDLLEKLDEKYRNIIVLYYVVGFKISEIAKLLDIKESTVKTRLVRGRKSLAIEYDNESEKIKEEHTYAQKLL